MSGNARFAVAILVILVLGAASYRYLDRGRSDAAVAHDGTPVPLYADLGAYHWPIATRSAVAQQYFDQGLRLTYAFNHAEAIRAFEAATNLDERCAMCWWGIAYAYGPNINAPMDADAARAAHAALEQARARLEYASRTERALIEALASRYEAEPREERSDLDRAYAAAMADVRRSFPDDADVLTLHAEAVMNLRPWDYWQPDGVPREGIAEIADDLERVLAMDPDHPGACHYYIHAVEAQQPARAVACAERLAALMPGAGHLVHMPAHIYIRVGRWSDAIAANEHAVHADEQYIADQRPSGVYPIAYYPHNYHFLSFAATMAGRSAQAIDAARAVVANVPVEIARAVPPVEPLVAYAHLTLVTFGRWDDVLNEPVPPADLRFATALVGYARGVAYAAQRDGAGARAALDTVRAVLAATADPLGRAVLGIAQHALAGEIDLRSGNTRGAETHFRAAVEIEDGLLYMEPPHWYYPVRHSLGAALLAAGRAADAEQVYRADLERFPENVWSLSGLRAALEAQGRRDEAATLEPRLAALRGDVRLATSRL